MQANLSINNSISYDKHNVRPMITYMSRLKDNYESYDSFVHTNPNCKDGVDDGNIGFKEGVKNMGAGVIQFLEGTVCDKEGNFSFKRVAKTFALALGVTAASLMVPGAGVAFSVFGLGMGALHMATAGEKIANAKTDSAAADAWQDMGAATLEEGLAAIWAYKSSTLMKNLKDFGVDLRNENRISILLDKFMTNFRIKMKTQPNTFAVMKEMGENLCNGSRIKKQVESTELVEDVLCEG